MFSHKREDALLFILTDGHVLPGGTHNYQVFHFPIDEEIDQFAQRGKIYTSILMKGRYDRYARTPEILC
jgi:hypothetical protein